MSTPTPTNNEQMDELDTLIAKYTDYMECEEYHIHDGSHEHEGTTALPHDFDEDKFKAALQLYISQHYVPIGQASDEGLDSIKGLRCPACNREALFVAAAGYITCGNLECPNPDYEAAIAQHTKEAVEAEIPFRLERTDNGITSSAEGTITPDNLEEMVREIMRWLDAGGTVAAPLASNKTKENK